MRRRGLLDTKPKYKTGLAFDSKFLLHDGPPGHPENPERLRSIIARLNPTFWDDCHIVQTREALIEELLYVHRPEMIDKVERLTPGVEDTLHYIDGDTYINQYSAHVAKLAVGTVLNLTKKVITGELDNGFAIIRPPGHHAKSNLSMGFCLYNNVAVAAQYALNLGLKRVLILDWDVHHGNGTEEIFYYNESVLYMSVHKGGNYFPNTGKVGDVGKGSGYGKTVNVPFECAGMGDWDYMCCFDFVFLPIIASFKPEMIFVSAGFDCGRGDRIGPMNVSTAGFSQMMSKLMNISNGKIVAVLEGGYTYEVTADGVNSCINVLLGNKPTSLKKGYPSWWGLRDIYRALRIQSRHWPSIDFVLNCDIRWKFLKNMILHHNWDRPFNYPPNSMPSSSDSEEVKSTSFYEQDQITTKVMISFGNLFGLPPQSLWTAFMKSKGDSESLQKGIKKQLQFHYSEGNKFGKRKTYSLTSERFRNKSQGNGRRKGLLRRETKLNWIKMASKKRKKDYYLREKLLRLINSTSGNFSMI